MARRLHVHIGASKTGTTFVQGMLQANRAELEEQGFLFPESLIDHFRFMLSVLDRLQDFARPPAAYTAFDRIAQACDDWPGPAIVSNELLAAATPAQVRRLVDRFAPADVHIVYTVRDVARTLPAEWQQSVKGGASMPLDTFVQGVIDSAGTPLASMPNVVGETDILRKFHALHDVGEVLSRWAQVLGRDRVHVVTLPPPGADPNVLWERFAQAVGFDAAAAARPPRRRNESLGVADAELLRRVNAALDQSPGHDRAMCEWVRHQYVLPILMGGASRTKIAIRPEHHAWARKQAHHYIDTLGDSGYHVVGDLEDLVPAEPDRDAVHPDEVESDDVAAAAVDSIAGLLSRYRAAAAG